MLDGLASYILATHCNLSPSCGKCFPESSFENYMMDIDKNFSYASIDVKFGDETFKCAYRDYAPRLVDLEMQLSDDIGASFNKADLDESEFNQKSYPQTVFFIKDNLFVSVSFKTEYKFLKDYDVTAQGALPIEEITFIKAGI